MIRLNLVALLVGLVAASGSTSAEHFGHGHSGGQGRGDCNCNQGQDSWNTGCCDQSNDCCKGWWDGYCAEKHHCKIKEKFAQYRSQVICNPQPSCGGCASEGCRTIAMPKMPCLTMPKMPCLTMPKVRLPHSDCGNCRSMGTGCGCGLGLHSLKLPSLDFHSWRRTQACLGGCTSCGAAPDACGCGHGGEVNYHNAPEYQNPGYQVPGPPAHYRNAPVPAELNPAPLPPSDSPRTDEIERSAALSALRTLLP